MGSHHCDMFEPEIDDISAIGAIFLRHFAPGTWPSSHHPIIPTDRLDEHLDLALIFQLRFSDVTLQIQLLLTHLTRSDGLSVRGTK